MFAITSRMRIFTGALAAAVLVSVSCARAPSNPEVGAAAPATPSAVAETAPSPPIRIRVTAANWEWEIRYPGADGVLDSEDDVLDRQNLHLPAGSHVTLELESRDYSYSFYVPDYDLIEVALPGPPYRREFDSGAAGVHKLLGSQMCGYAHPDLLGDVTVMRPEEFEAWISSGPSDRRPPSSASDPAS